MGDTTVMEAVYDVYIIWIAILEGGFRYLGYSIVVTMGGNIY